MVGELSGSAITVSLGNRQIIDRQDFVFPRGWTAFLGRNGAGKTTLLRALAGVLPSSGRLTYDGVEISGERDWRAFRRTLGWMPQDPALPNGMRVRQLVEYAAWLKSTPDSAQAAAVESAVTAGGAFELLNRKVGQLSGGEKRRVALSCALVGAPQVLLLDEPSVGLDPEQRDGFDKRLRVLKEAATVVYSTHLLEDVIGADRVCVLDAGQVIFNGTIQEFTEGADPNDMMVLRSSLRRIGAV